MTNNAKFTKAILPAFTLLLLFAVLAAHTTTSYGATAKTTTASDHNDPWGPAQDLYVELGAANLDQIFMREPTINAASFGLVTSQEQSAILAHRRADSVTLPSNAAWSSDLGDFPIDPQLLESELASSGNAFVPVGLDKWKLLNMRWPYPVGGRKLTAHKRILNALSTLRLPTLRTRIDRQLRNNGYVARERAPGQDPNLDDYHLRVGTATVWVTVFYDLLGKSAHESGVSLAGWRPEDFTFQDLGRTMLAGDSTKIGGRVIRFGKVQVDQLVSLEIQQDALIPLSSKTAPYTQNRVKEERISYGDGYEEMVRKGFKTDALYHKAQPRAAIYTDRVKKMPDDEYRKCISDNVKFNGRMDCNSLRLQLEKMRDSLLSPHPSKDN